MAPKIKKATDDEATPVVVPPQYRDGIAPQALALFLWERQLTIATQANTLLGDMKIHFPQGYDDSDIEATLPRWKGLGWVA